MRIGFDARMIDWTGVGTYSYNLVKSLIEIDKENEYILFCDKRSISQVPSADNFSKRIISESVFSPSHQLFFSITLRKQELDIFHSPHFISPLFLSCPSVITINDLIPLMFPPSMPSKIGQIYYRRTNNKAIRKAGKVITVSESTRRDIIENFNISEKKVQIIYDGVGEEFDIIKNKNLINRAKERNKISSPYLLNVGNPKPHKNWIRLIKAFASLGSIVKDHQLVLVGSPDPRYPEITRAIKQLRLEDKVIITGFVKENDMALLYNAADALIFPSLYEGFGLPVLEAMACGTPVVCSNTSSLPEVAGDAALMVDPADKESIAEGIKRILSDKKLRQSLSEKGLKRKGLFSWTKTAQQTLDVYNKAQAG